MFCTLFSMAQNDIHVQPDGTTQTCYQQVQNYCDGRQDQGTVQFKCNTIHVLQGLYQARTEHVTEQFS